MSDHPLMNDSAGYLEIFGHRYLHVPTVPLNKMNASRKTNQRRVITCAHPATLRISMRYQEIRKPKPLRCLNSPDIIAADVPTYQIALGSAQ
jgi:hypothetical protein